MLVSKPASALAVLICAALTAGGALAGAHGGAKVSDVEALPARTGDWTPEEIARGREQLVRAFDAAWVRIIASGKDREILATEPASTRAPRNSTSSGSWTACRSPRSRTGRKSRSVCSRISWTLG